MIGGCSRRPTLSPLPGGSTLLAFGDSLTEGKGVGRHEAYPAILERLSGFRVVNAGVSGEVTAEGLARLPDVLDETRPRLMLLMHGGNDILRGLDRRSMRANLAAMIELARERGVDVVLVGVPEKRLFSESAPEYAELARHHGLVFEPEIIGSLMRSPSMKSDAVHFNARGYRRIAETLHDRLREAGAI